MVNIKPMESIVRWLRMLMLHRALCRGGHPLHFLLRMPLCRRTGRCLPPISHYYCCLLSICFNILPVLLSFTDAFLSPRSLSFNV